MNKDRISQLTTLLQEAPDDPFIHHALALEHLKKDEVHKALEHFEKVLQIDADYVGTYYHLGKLFEKLDQPEAARKTYLKGMEVAKAKGERQTYGELMTALDLMD